MKKKKQKVCIIGAGVVGCAVAYVLSKTKKYEVIVLEKNIRIPGLNQSSHNAGVIHAGIYYSPSEEPLKAKMCVEGNRLLYAFCKKHKVPYLKFGKLIVATNKLEEEYVDHFYKIALKNRVPHLKKLDKKQIKKLEPNIHAISALYVPTSGVVNTDRLVIKLRQLSERGGTIFLTSSKVMGISTSNKLFQVLAHSHGKSKIFSCDIVINAAGLFSDEIAKMVNPKSSYQIIPTRGEFVSFKNTKDMRITRNVYQAPYAYFKQTGEKANVSLKDYLKLIKSGIATRTVGVHLTPTVLENSSIGKVSLVGPLKTVGIKKDHYKGKLKSNELYIQKIRHFFPQIHADDVTPYYTGIMAIEKSNRDFVIERDKKYPSFINLIGIESPGMTSCLAIAKYVKKLL